MEEKEEPPEGRLPGSGQEEDEEGRPGREEASLIMSELEGQAGLVIFRAQRREQLGSWILRRVWKG